MFNSIYFNGEEYNQMWLNGNKIWEKNSGGSGDYSDADCIITYYNESTSAVTKEFEPIDIMLPYSINGTRTTTFSFPSKVDTKVKLVNLKPTTGTSATFYPVNYEKLYLPYLTDLSYLFSYFGYNSSYAYSWSPQYFEFNQNPTSMEKMFYFGWYLTDKMMDEFIPILKTMDTSNVTNTNRMFYNCRGITSIDLSSLNSSLITSTDRMFYNCTMLKEIDLSSFNTSSVTTSSMMFSGVSNATIYIGDNWTLGTSATTGNGTNLTFVKGSSGGDSGSGDTGGDSGGTTTNSLLVDWTQSTAPTLPSYMTVDGNNTYSFSHGTFTTDVYGLIPSNKGLKSSTAYTRYKYVAPASGDLTFTYRCSSESSCDYLAVHVDTSTSQPTYSNSTNRVLYVSGTKYVSTDKTAGTSVSVVEGTTYYIHIQYRKDSSGNSGYDMGCIRKIELVE